MFKEGDIVKFVSISPDATEYSADELLGRVGVVESKTGDYTYFLYFIKPGYNDAYGSFFENELELATQEELDIQILIDRLEE